MGFLFPRVSKPKQFHYRPLYYDERKERLEKIKAKAEAELAAEKEKTPFTKLEKGFLSERRSKSSFRETEGHKSASAIRFLIILIAILGIFYFVAPDVFLAFWKFK